MLDTINSGGKAAFARPARTAYGAALSHSGRVRRLKVLLPVAAVVVSLAFIAVSMVRAYLPENLKIEGAKIENGKASPSLPMLHRLVEALDSNIGWMFEETDGEEGIVFRSGTRPLISLDPLRRGEGISLERIIPYSTGHLLQCNIHHIEAGGRSAGPIKHVGEEVGYILAGSVELVVGDDTFNLSVGDSFVFNSELPHSYRNVGESRASIFWVNTPPTF